VIRLEVLAVCESCSKLVWFVEITTGVLLRYDALYATFAVTFVIEVGIAAQPVLHSHLTKSDLRPRKFLQQYNSDCESVC